MIELEAFTVCGLRSLAQMEELPVRGPTIITGANDGGKSSTLRAVAFLLGEWLPTAEDFTVLGPAKSGNEPLRVEQMIVEGQLALDATERAELGLGGTLRLRRIAETTLATRYEIRARRPVDPALRGLEDKKLADLKDLAKDLELPPTGSRNLRESWLAPLRAHIASAPHEDDWVAAPKALLQRLPIMMIFSSTEEPDPEGQIRGALQAAYRELLTDDEIVGPVRMAEKIVQERLAQRADELCQHVAARCPELSSIEVRPQVTFREGLGNVSVLASRPGGAGIPLNQSGAGRRRRVNLAIWEWTGELVQPRAAADRAVVIAYDEPDTHLDYGHQRELVSLIRQQCEKPGVRMLVATHSLNLIDRVAIENVVHLRLEGERTVAERLMSGEHEDIQRYLVGVSDAMGLRNSVLLHERCFVGVEGATEVQALPVLFRLVTGMSLQSAGIALISGNGNDGALKVVKFLKDHGRRLAFVVVDADSSDGKLFRPEKLRAQGVEASDIHYVGCRELEDAFSNAQWVEVANREWPRKDGELWAEDDFAGLRIGTKFSSALANSVREASEQAPQGKPGYLLALVQGLTSSDQVPEKLADVLHTLEQVGAAEFLSVAPTATRQRKASPTRARRRFVKATET